MQDGNQHKFTLDHICAIASKSPPVPIATFPTKANPRIRAKSRSRNCRSPTRIALGPCHSCPEISIVAELEWLPRAPTAAFSHPPPRFSFSLPHRIRIRQAPVLIDISLHTSRHSSSTILPQLTPTIPVHFKQNCAQLHFNNFSAQRRSEFVAIPPFATLHCNRRTQPEPRHSWIIFHRTEKRARNSAAENFRVTRT